MGKLFYMQDSRGSGCVGNDILWWAKERKGYTTDITKAHVFTLEEAQGQHNSRETDIPWPKEYIDERVRPVVDIQKCDRSVALQSSGIKIVKPKPIPKEVHNCPECGSFMSEYQWYSGCPKCDWHYSG
jgi:ribosomal protein S27AE